MSTKRKGARVADSGLQSPLLLPDEPSWQCCPQPVTGAATEGEDGLIWISRHSLHVSCCSHFWDKTSDRRQLKKETAYFNTQFWGVLGEEAIASGAWHRFLVTLHPQPESREPWILAFAGIPYLFWPGPHPSEWCCHIEDESFHLRRHNLNHPPEACLEACLVGDSRACQIDSINHHSLSTPSPGLCTWGWNLFWVVK